MFVNADYLFTDALQDGYIHITFFVTVEIYCLILCILQAVHVWICSVYILKGNSD